MRYLRAVLIAIVAVSAWPLAARDNVYFSVSSNKTFQPNQKVHVQVYAQNVDVLEFRIYRIQDPVKFFQHLEDVHGFGSEQRISPERIEERAPLERFHDWKHYWWVRMRDFFRGQFSARSRAAIRARQTEKVKRSRISGTAGFARVPLLNSEQLVARWRVDVPPKYFSESAAVPIESFAPGAYLLEATDGQYKAYTVILVSSMALITKTSPGHALAYAVDRETGAPLADCAVTVWADKQVRAQFTTGANGVGQAEVAGLRRTSDGEEEFGAEGDWILGVRGKDVAIVAPYSLNLSSNPARDWIGYVYTDRPVYRPGHTVYVKAILRKRNGDALALPGETTAQIRVQGPDQETVLDQRLPLSALGTARAQFELPAKAPLGYYNIEVLIGKGSAGGSFFVEEYKKPEYKVTVTPERARVLQGEAIRATIEARYYFGEPVANAKLKYVVHTARAWSSWDEDEESFGYNVGEEEGGYDYAGEQQSEQEGQLDANGRLVVTLPTRVAKDRYDVTYRVEARVTDAANREIAGHGSVLATYGSFHVRVQPQSYVYTGVQPVQMTVEARDYDQHPIPTPIRVELRKHQYGQEDVVELAVDQRTGPDGKAMFSVTPPRAGSFLVMVTAKTPEGREVQGTSWLWVAGPGEYTWGETRQVEIVPDKKSYKVGETARLLVVNIVPGAHILLTSEAKTVLSTQVIEAKDANTTVEVPITDLDQPNFYVSAVFMSRDEIYIGNKSLSVPAVEKRLNIEVQSSKAQFQPGEDASFTVRVTDWAGKPVAAEFSLGVVDDALYAVRPDRAGDIASAFYEQRYYSAVTTENSLTFSFQGEAGKRSLQLAGGGTAFERGRLAYRARMAQIKPGADLVMPKVRKAFPDTAFWTADASTDASGRAVVHMTFPDSLTTWRATVRAVTADTRAGAAVNRVLVRKNVIVRIAAPRFFRSGDEVTVTAIAHNYLETAKQARVSLDITGVDVLSGSPQTVTLPSRGEAKLDWRVRARSGAPVKLLAKALTNEESDAMEMSLPVVPFGVRMTNTFSGTIDAGSARVSLGFPGQSESASRSAEVTLTPSVAGAIFSALDYLTAYPYGCTEQTMSSFLPNVIVARAMQELNLKSNVDEAALREKINAGLERLYDFQHEDGGWGWWKEDASMVFMTSYVVAGLSQASEARYDVRAEALAKGKTYLRQQLREHARMIPDLQAYVVYALVQSGERDRGMLDALWEKKDRLSPQGVAFAGLAAQIMGDARSSEAAKMLEASARQEGEAVYWPSPYDYLLDIAADDSAEATAYAMRLLTAVDPRSPLLPKAAVWLVQHRRGDYWDTTKQTAMVIYGITDYVKSSHELQPNFTAEVLVNGRLALTRKFTAADAMSRPATVEVPGSALAANDKVEIRKAGGGRLYWSVVGQYFSSDKKNYQSGQLSLNIARDYFRLKPVKTEAKMYYELEPLSGPLQIGDVLAVRVSVNGGRWKYLLIEDPIPGGAEFIQRDDLYEVRNKPSWWQSWWSRREFHDDRAAIFQTDFSGRSEFFYLLKIVNPGIFRISPALVQPMYQPNVISTTDPATVEVK